MPAERTRARVEDIHELALAMPYVTVEVGSSGNHVYQVGGKSFVFFRTPRPDATDPETGERYRDVIVFWVASEADKQALVEDPATPFFTTPHFNGHSSVLLRGSTVGELTREELAEVVQDAWLARASNRRRAAWLAAREAGAAEQAQSAPAQAAARHAHVAEQHDSPSRPATCNRGVPAFRPR